MRNISFQNNSNCRSLIGKLSQLYRHEDAEACQSEYEMEMEEAAKLGVDWMTYVTMKLSQKEIDEKRSRISNLAV